MEFLKIVILIVAFYYVFKYGMRLLMPFLMKKAAERIFKKAQEQQQHNGQFRNGQGSYFYGSFNNGQQQNKKPQGDVSVDFIPPQEEPRKGTETAGEFIDFEEVK